MYGNTKKIAATIAQVFPGAKVMEDKDFDSSVLDSIDLLISGSPTHGGRPKPSWNEFLQKIPAEGLKGKKFAVFDTRFWEPDLNFALRLLVKTIGYAAPRMSASLKSLGGEEAVEPMGFIVTGKSGPIKEGELSKAEIWAKSIS